MAYKIVTNLVMLLPVLASYLRFDDAADVRLHAAARGAPRCNGGPRTGRRDAQRGDRHDGLRGAVRGCIRAEPGPTRRAPRLGCAELRPDSRYNLDAASIVGGFDLGLDVLTVVFETPKDDATVST
ncbi:MAG: hypothetical protein U1F11_15600 [Steroidobacteraceae bacterium]